MPRGIKRNAADSTTSLTNAFQVITNPIQPSPTMPDVPMSYFSAVIAGRERATWSELDIHVASQLAVTLKQIDDLLHLVEREGWFLTDSFGKVYRHPVGPQLSALYAIQAKLCRQLGLTATVRGLTQGEQKTRNTIDGEVRRVSERADKADGLLA